MAEIPKGYIITPRVFYESDIGEKPPHFRETWQWLIQKANHKEINIRHRTIQRGQVLTDYNEIIDALKWYVGRRKERYENHQIETALKYFKRTGMITKMKANKKLIITICKYDYYQDASNYENHNESHNETGMKTRRKPHYKQESKNVNNSSVCDTTIHTFSIETIEKLFAEREIILAQKANQGTAIKFHGHYNVKEWIFDGKPMEDLTPHIDKWIQEDVLKRQTNEPKKMIYKLPAGYNAGNPAINQ